jgi:hypothetical protein
MASDYRKSNKKHPALWKYEETLKPGCGSGIRQVKKAMMEE